MSNPIDITPNFFIVGAPKCGTTALSAYLQSHPNVFMTTPKEPHYFATDLPEYRAVRTEPEYRNLFQECTAAHRAIGEGSVWYLYSSQALENISRFYGQSKIVIMLRNPVDMVYSMHSQHLYSLDEDQASFEDAWKLQTHRRKGRCIPNACRDVKTLMYADIAKFGTQVENVFRIFPQEQVKIILFDDFKAHTRSVYQETLAFLNIPQDGRDDFPQINVNKRHRFNFIAQFIRNPPEVLRKLNRSLDKTMGSNLNWSRQLLRKINTRVESRQPLSEELRREIVAAYKDDIMHLSRLINRSLEIWLQ